MMTKIDDVLKEIWDSLTAEQKEQIKACKTPGELMAYMGKAGIKLPDEVLDAVAGGYVFWNDQDQFEAIRDSDGEVMGTFGTLKDAMDYADNHNQSRQMISWDVLKFIRRQK